MNDFGIDGLMNMSSAPTANMGFDMSSLSNMATPNMSMLDNGLAGEIASVGNQAGLDMTSAFNPNQLMSNASKDGLLANIGNTIGDTASSIGNTMGDYGGKAIDLLGQGSLKDYSALASGVGGLYSALKAGKVADMQVADMKDKQRFAEKERSRGEDFRNKTAMTFSGGSTAGNSDYYSA